MNAPSQIEAYLTSGQSPGELRAALRRLLAATKSGGAVRAEDVALLHEEAAR